MIASMPDTYLLADANELNIEGFDLAIDGGYFTLCAEADVSITTANDYDPGDGYWTPPSGGDFIKEIDIKWTEITLSDDDGNMLGRKLFKEMTEEEIFLFTYEAKCNIMLDESL